MGSDDRSPTDQDEEFPDEGPTMTEAGAMPSGSETGWKTSQPNPDATRPETMPESATEADTE